jgi:hypothetical protein
MPKTTKSPTQRTMAQLRKEEVNLVQIVEYWNGWGKCRIDLFGFIDVVAVTNTQTIGIQVTTGANVAARIKKIRLECSHQLMHLLNAGWRIEVHGWRKIKATGRWELRRIQLTFHDNIELNPSEDEE